MKNRSISISGKSALPSGHRTASAFGLFVFLAVLLATGAGAGQDLSSLSRGTLEPGPYKAGFRVAYEYDRSRTVSSRYDYRGRLACENNARPVQIAIWYPCRPADNAKHMRYAEYEVTRGTRFDYERDRAEILASYPNRFGSPGTDRDLVRNIRNQILARETTAYKDAPPANGPFPLVLFCSGGGDAPDSHDVLFEFLASHGYTIAAVSSQGMFQRAPAYNLMDEESQVRDMEFAREYMSDEPEVDPLSVCAMGYSYGGLVNVLFALRNFDVAAVLCLDGSICLKDRDRCVKQLPYFTPTRLTSAFMNMARKPHPEQDFGFYNGLIYSDAYLMHFDTLGHAQFTSRPFVGDYSKILSEKNRNVTGINRSQEIVCRYTLRFLDTYLRHDAEAAEFLANSTEENGLDPETVRIESKKAFPYPPRDREFFRLLEEEGIDAAVNVYNEARGIEPGIILFDEETMNQQGYAYLNDGRVENAVILFSLNVDSYPDSWNAYDSLGEAYMKNGQNETAVENYKKSLAINPGNNNAVRMLHKLEE